MRCPYCKSQSVLKHGFKQKGQQPYFCLTCQREFRKRSITGLWLGALFALGVPLILLSILLLQDLVGNPDHGELANAIVVLGRGPNLNEERALVTAQLLKENRAPKVFVSGMIDAPEIITILQQMGVSKNRISGERCSQNTWENGLFTKILLSHLKPQRILLVTDQAHIRRAASVFRAFGFEVVAYPIRSEMSLEQGQLQLRELLGLITYYAAGKLSPVRPDQIRQEEVEAKYKIQTWKCRLPE